ncbi:DotH/IcmK family type IV secretion protein [Marinobacterium jannaschii]|uniref:DotH/IcmK family type IV secretion protein n=1 Tax=Marinobacterium jannaschii TaxID=64970 RepID=UPI00047F7A24|nr:DotH/IcmK family type IV secretion protein [Marinobacterium jannaschii]
MRIKSYQAVLLALAACPAVWAADTNAAKDNGVFDIKVAPDAEVKKAVTQAMGGISPEATRQVDEQIEDYSRAKRFRPEATAISETYPLSLKAGASRPTIYVTPHRQTSLVFLDINGRPWNVQEAYCGDCPDANGSGDGRFKSKRSDAKQHVIQLEALQDTLRTNITLFFDGIDIPFEFAVESTSTQYHSVARMVLPLAAPGQGALTMSASGTTSSTAVQSQAGALSASPLTPVVRKILDGQAAMLDGLEALSVDLETLSGRPVAGTFSFQAWLSSEGTLYVATNARAPQPPAMRSVAGTHGLSVFEFTAFHDVLSLVDNASGQRVIVSLRPPKDRLGYVYQGGVNGQ